MTLARSLGGATPYPLGARAALRSETCLYVAAAGYGKTSALEAACGQAATVYLRAPDLAAALGADRCPDPLQDPTPSAHILVDDVGDLPRGLQHRLALTLSALPAGTRVSMASRRPLPAQARSLLRGVLRERGATDLALPRDAVARVLRDEHGVTDPETVHEVHDVTAGWPGLVHLAGDALGHGGLAAGDLLAALAEPGTPTASWVGDQVLADLPDEVARLLDTAVDLDAQSADLHELLGTLPPARARKAFGWLVRTGLMMAHPRYPGRAVPRVVPVVAAVVARRRPGGASPAARAHLLRAGGWYAEHGLPLAAAVVLDRSLRSADAVELVRARSDEMLAAGGAAEVARLLGSSAADPAPTDPHLRMILDEMLAAGRAAEVTRLLQPSGPDATATTDRHLRMILGDALRMSGDISGAGRAFAPLVAEARRSGYWDIGLAWRVASLHYMCARSAEAVEVTDCALAAAGETVASLDLVLLLACRAHSLRALGARPEAAVAARRALTVAEALGTDRALAAAHLAMAGTLVGTGCEDHLACAEAAAQRAGDLVVLARVLVNKGDCLLHAARYVEAAEVCGLALDYAENGSPPGILVTALHNAGEALLRLGRFDEAAQRFERSIGLCRRAGLRRTAMGLWGLAEIHRQLGRREQSITAFEAAIEVARETSELHVLLPAMHGLTRVLLEVSHTRLTDREPDELEQTGHPKAEAAEVVAAEAVAAEALRLAPPLSRLHALLAAGRVALARGDVALARQRAAAAVSEARASRAADAVADALELVACAASGGAAPGVTPADSESSVVSPRAALREALAIWVGAGAEPAADRVRVLLGRPPGADAADRAAARAGARRLVALGIDSVDGQPVVAADSAAGVQVRVLGGFDVLVAGRPVPLPAWRSRQARTLVKILVARRGRTVPRSELCELLWPDDEPQRTAHRLSVILSVVRTVLDPDRSWPPDHHIRADANGMSLDLAHVDVDVERLLADAAHAAALLRSGAVARGYELLDEIDARYRGGAFDDEPYEDWADGLREQARAVWLRSLRHLARLSGERGDDHHAATALVRLLTADPYDDGSHRALVQVLVQAGRHGEARRAFDRWTLSMRSIDAPPPDAGVLRDCRGVALPVTVVAAGRRRQARSALPPTRPLPARRAVAGSPVGH